MSKNLVDEKPIAQAPQMLRHTFGVLKRVHSKYFATLAISAVVVAFALSMFLMGALGR